MQRIGQARSETRREIAQHLTHLNTYVTGALVVLLAGSVLILQRIAEDRRETKRHQEIKDRAAAAVNEAETEMGRLRMEFLHAVAEANKRTNAKVVASADDLYVFNAALDALRPDGGPDIQNALIATATRRLRELAVADITYRNAEISLQHNVAQAHALIRAREANEAKLETLQEVSREKSFPTPVGEIDLDPEVALAGLAVIAAAAYLFLIIATRRVMELMPRANGGSVSVVAPVWLYTAEPACRKALGWQTGDGPTRLTTALVVHGSWLLLSLGLMCAMFVTNAHRSVAFVADGAVATIVVFANAAALFAFLAEFLSPAYDASGQLTPAGEIRRALIGTVIAAVVWAPLALMVRRDRVTKQDSAEPPSPDLAKLTDQLRQNPKTKAVHHQRVCKRHLPKKGGPAQAKPALHPRLEPMIVLAAVNDFEKKMVTKGTASKKSSPEEKKQQAEHLLTLVPVLEEAIKAYPLHFPLHDKLIRIYGRLKNYERIGKLIDESLTQATAIAEKTPTKAAKRAVEAFTFRQERNRKRKHPA